MLKRIVFEMEDQYSCCDCPAYTNEYPARCKVNGEWLEGLWGKRPEWCPLEDAPDVEDD